MRNVDRQAQAYRGKQDACITHTPDQPDFQSGRATGHMRCDRTRSALRPLSVDGLRQHNQLARDSRAQRCRHPSS